MGIKDNSLPWFLISLASWRVFCSDDQICRIFILMPRLCQLGWNGILQYTFWEHPIRHPDENQCIHQLGREELIDLWSVQALHVQPFHPYYVMGQPGSKDQDPLQGCKYTGWLLLSSSFSNSFVCLTQIVSTKVRNPTCTLALLPIMTRYVST